MKGGKLVEKARKAGDQIRDSIGRKKTPPEKSAGLEALEEEEISPQIPLEEQGAEDATGRSTKGLNWGAHHPSPVRERQKRTDSSSKRVAVIQKFVRSDGPATEKDPGFRRR